MWWARNVFLQTSTSFNTNPLLVPLAVVRSHEFRWYYAEFSGLKSRFQIK
jgi:hypothetical protein